MQYTAAQVTMSVTVTGDVLNDNRAKLQLQLTIGLIIYFFYFKLGHHHNITFDPGKCEAISEVCGVVHCTINLPTLNSYRTTQS